MITSIPAATPTISHICRRHGNTPCGTGGWSETGAVPDVDDGSGIFIAPALPSALRRRTAFYPERGSIERVRSARHTCGCAPEIEPRRRAVVGHVQGC